MHRLRARCRRPPSSSDTVPVWASHSSSLATRCQAEVSPAGSRKWIRVAVGRTRPSGRVTVTADAQVCRYQPPSGCGVSPSDSANTGAAEGVSVMAAVSVALPECCP